MNERENPLRSVPTEFVTEAFDTEVSESQIESVATAVSDAVADLRESVGDDRLEELLRDGEATTLMARDSAENEDPEPITKRTVIEPLFAALGYPDPAVEAGDRSDERGKQADYSFSLAEYDDVDSGRLLVEAEPMNKRLDQESHGLGQVKDWLDRKKFDANFGLATDGLRWVLVKYDRDTYSYDTLAEVNLQRTFVKAFENQTGRNVGLDEWVEGDDRELVETFVRSFGYENFVSIASEARAVIKETKAEITDEFYDEYVQYVFGIRPDGEERTTRSLVGDGVIAPEAATGDDVRLFAVGLMNRLVFLKFLEDKRLVDADLLRKLVADHDDGLNPETFYKTYLEPLFFGILDEKPDDRTGRIRDIDVYSEVPYLNGGLFRPTSEWDGDVNEREFDVRDTVLLSIVDLLERHDFSADGGPTDLDPSVLGNVFEKTINHITGDAGDQKKELGAYYTPDEITRFCAEETVQPALLERFADRMVAEWGWTDEMADYDDVYELVDALPETNTDLIEDLLAVVDEFRALDPACGSGHFLTSVQSELVGIRKALYEKHDETPPTWKLHKQTVVQNVYGVDIVNPAVEIAKLRLWLSIITEVDPDEVATYDDEELALPNVVFNVRQGNSLIGYTDLMETSSDSDQSRLDAWGADTVREKYGDIIELVEKHKATSDTEEAKAYLEDAEELLDQYRDDLDEKVLLEFKEAGIEDIGVEQVREYEPFHWVLEFAQVYGDGGFDVIVGNPPWEVLTVNRDDFFSQFDSRFRTRTPSEKDQKQKELLERDEREIQPKWQDYQRRMKIRSTYFKKSGSYELQTPKVAGRTVANENDLSALFLERVLKLADNDGYVSQVLPGVVFTGASCKDLRKHLLNQTRVNSLVTFENHGIFDDIDNRYNFGTLVLKNSGETDVLKGKFVQKDLRILKNLDEEAISISKTVLGNFSPEASIFPSVNSGKETDVLEKVLKNPAIGEQSGEKWYADPYTELHLSQDSDRLVEEKYNGDYPVLGGRNVYQYSYSPDFVDDLESPNFWSVSEETDPEKSGKQRIREKNLPDLKRSVYDEFGGEKTSKSQKQFVNDLLEDERGEPLTEEDVLLDCTEYRLAYREIARSTDERTMIAAIIPKGVISYHKLPTLRPYSIQPEEKHLQKKRLHGAYNRIFTDKELFVALGLLNSIPFDFLMRTKIDSSIVQYKFKESQVPRLTSGDDWFEYISHRAARLNCYGEQFAEMRERLGGIDAATDPDERQRLQAEIDAAAFHAYGLDREETRFVLDDFHRVRDPRMMTEEYFDLVAETYDELAERGPMD
ncbi:Eco57I restriction-modification methylase domain-containing protein [Halorussus pelagicus]|uniref:Eco57I restriction-modification methylase domain-containing protein n=1 Tax=Halorussus pelagicus TaxID=2505977 RepID=UPI000FFCC0CB|nr:DNA methyltransferase [Halorussus pelagicus]